MENLGALLLRVLTVSAGCSAVLVPVLLLAPRLQRRVSARSFYVIFLLLAVRLAVPVEISLPQPAVRVSVPDYTVAVPAPAPRPAAIQAQPSPEDFSEPSVPVQAVPAAPVGTNSTPAVAVRKVPVTAILGMVWAAGALGCVLWAVGSFLLARRRLMRSARSAPPEETALLGALRSELGIRRPVRLCRSAMAPGPLALGLLRPVIVLPAGSGGKGLELILRHELTHIRRWDVAYKLALSLACAVNWFNPLVWRMDRAAGRNLELCCDDEVARNLTEAGRKEYGRVLLAAAGTARALPFTTCFSGGKEQMMSRMLNLFTRKKNSAALVCVVLAAALLAGGLVACERSEEAARLSAEVEQRRALLRGWFDDNCADACSAVLADVTGDGQEELLALTLYDRDGGTLPAGERMEADQFGWGSWVIAGVREGEAVQLGGLRTVGSAHVGWGCQYLVPQETGFAVLEYDPYEGQGLAGYNYVLSRLTEEGEWMELDSDRVFFSLLEEGSLLTQGMEFSTEEEIDSFLSRVRAYRDSGVPLLCYDEGTEGRGFSYLNVAPADAFAGKTETVSELKDRVSETPSPENQVRRTLFQAYFAENYTEENTSVVLADLTGDGLEELLVITLDPLEGKNFPLTADSFTYGDIDCCTVKDGEVVALVEEETCVADAHVGWGYVYLIPNPAGEGYAILDFRPGVGMGMAGYSYSVYTLGAEGFVTAEQGNVQFLVAGNPLLGAEDSDGASLEEVEALLDRAYAYRESGVPLLVYDVGFEPFDGREFAYLDTPPAEVFRGAIAMDIRSLRAHVVSEGGPLSFKLPQPVPTTPEEALDALEKNIYINELDIVELLVPEYDGTWDIALVCQPLMGWRGEDKDEPIYATDRYGEEDEWTPGMLYRIGVKGSYMKDLTVEARVTAPDGTVAERSITLLHEQYTPGALWAFEEVGE